jgi:hypothetical protein
MFVGKARANPSEAPFMCVILECTPGLTYKQLTWLEWPARDKHTSLLQTLLITVVKRFIALGPGPNVTKLFTFVIYECS